MKSKKRILSTLSAAIIMVLFILDTGTVFTGASDGLDLCIKVIIPSLFPFFMVTTYLNASLLGLQIPGLRIIGKLLKVPVGGESLLLLGLIGGYPVGAQLIADTYRQGILDKRTTQILLGYCSNAGPAFIFAVASTLFTSFRTPFILWGVHLFSAVATGLLLPRPYYTSMFLENRNHISLVQALRKSISICVTVCGWVVVFKIVMAYISRWFAQCFKNTHMILITGILELSNGCIMLREIPNEAECFILCAVFLAFGGICVTLQTMSATQNLGLGLYVPGKIIQTCISLLTAVSLAYMLFPSNGISFFMFGCMILICVPIILVSKRYSEKRCGNQE